MDYNSPEFLAIRESIQRRRGIKESVVPTQGNTNYRKSIISAQVLEILYLDRHMTYEEIGQLLGRTRQRIGQLIHQYKIDTTHGEKFISICPFCSKQFKTTRSSFRKTNLRYCSHECYVAHRREVSNHIPNHQGQIIARMIMTVHLARPLLDTEIVHHEDGDQNNNDIDNLILFVSVSEHIRYHHQKRIWTKKAPDNRT